MLITFEQLPEAVSQMFCKLESIERLLIHRNNSAQPESEDLISIQQAAALLKLSVHTIYGLVSRSEIPSMKKGRRLYFFKSQLHEWIKTGKKKTIAEIAIEADEFLSSNKKRGTIL